MKRTINRASYRLSLACLVASFTWLGLELADRQLVRELGGLQPVVALFVYALTFATINCMTQPLATEAMENLFGVDRDTASPNPAPSEPPHDYRLGEVSWWGWFDVTALRLLR